MIEKNPMWRPVAAEVSSLVRTAVNSLVHVQRADVETQLKEQRSVDGRMAAGPTRVQLCTARFDEG